MDIEAIRQSVEAYAPQFVKSALSRLDSKQLVGVATSIAGILLLNLILILRALGKPSTLSTLDGQWQKFKLIKKTEVSDNTAIYRFALPSEKHYLGLPTGQHIQVQARCNGKDVQRSYTPISSDDDLGFFELMVKSYPQGNVSKHMGELKVGDTLEVKGPRGQMTYSPHYAVSLGMMAGGTGITPMLQVIRAAMKNPLDNTCISLIYANVEEKDILLKKELDDLAKQSGSRFKVHYVLDKPPPGWTHSEGRISEEIVKAHMPKSKVGNRIHLCGPPPMVNAMKKILEGLEFEKANTISKMPDQVFCY